MVTHMSLRLGLAILTVLGHAGVTYAEGVEEEKPADGFVAADTSTFTPGIARAENTGQGFALASTTFNSASNSTTVDVVGDFRLYKDVHLVLRADNITHTGRPGVGMGYQFLHEDTNGVASTAYLVYKTEGFAEIEGEIEALVSLEKQFGAVRAIANVAYGQDADAKERDGEVAIGAHTTVIPNRVIAGLVGRYRDALGSGGDHGVLRDMFGGAAGTVAVGSLGLTAMFGFAGFQTAATPTHAATFATGVAGTLAVGGGF